MISGKSVRPFTTYDSFGRFVNNFVINFIIPIMLKGTEHLKKVI